MQVDSTWSSANLRVVRWKIGDKTVVKVCHRVIAELTEEAFELITDAGLAPYVDVTSTRTSGGCYHARTVRALGSTSGVNLSVHSWGAALDFNVRGNCLGCVPTLRCEIVQIFRALGFAWGGNFLTPDGMHFEYVGTPRHHVPTRVGDYCPTVSPTGPQPASPRGSPSSSSSANAPWDHVLARN